MNEILRLEHIQKYYGNEGNITKAIDDISFSVAKGEFIGIMGASGSGKTTLLNCISTIDTASAGHIYLDGTDITEIKEKELARFRRINLGFVFQDFNLLDTLTISENIALALTINKVPAAEIDVRVENIARTLSIADILDKYPYQVSGGQKQRCACARAIINNPKLILADEPTGALDSHSSQMLLSTIQSIGETVYNSYTDVIYVFPDNICNNLLSVMRNRYVKTETPIPYNEAIYLENTFAQKYPEKPDNRNGVQYYIRTSTQQINSSIAGNFVLQATMIYSAVVLMVICLTILSLQQLLDAAHYKYRFGVLHKLGVDQQEAEHLILKQLAVWFGLPITIAAFVSIIVVAYFFETISVQISAYIGIGALLAQVGAMICILVILLICYFISTWILFQKSVTE